MIIFTNQAPLRGTPRTLNLGEGGGAVSRCALTRPSNAFETVSRVCPAIVDGSGCCARGRAQPAWPGLFA